MLQIKKNLFFSISKQELTSNKDGVRLRNSSTTAPEKLQPFGLSLHTSA